MDSVEQKEIMVNYVILISLELEGELRTQK